FFHLGRACDWEEWEELQLQPGYCHSPPDRWSPVPPAECHSLCPDGENFSCDFQRCQHSQTRAVHLAQHHRVWEQDHQPVSRGHCPGH
ncbi:hypothetical protein Nmel_015770, partial [Mimus melanotis]